MLAGATVTAAALEHAGALIAAARSPGAPATAGAGRGAGSRARRPGRQPVAGRRSRRAGRVSSRARLGVGAKPVHRVDPRAIARVRCREWPHRLLRIAARGAHRRRPAARPQRGQLPHRRGARPLRRRRRHGRPRRAAAPPRASPWRPSARTLRAGPRARTGRLRRADAPRGQPAPGRARPRGGGGLRRHLRARPRRTPSSPGWGPRSPPSWSTGATPSSPTSATAAAYLLRGDHIYQVTEDHSLVNEQIKARRITAEEARTSRYKNIITRSVGFEREVRSTSWGWSCEAGDTFVALLRRPLQHGRGPGDPRDRRRSAGSTRRAERLVDLANERGGDDNITVIVVRASAGAA